MGVGFQGGTDLGFMIAFAMTLHNVPEGIGIGAPLKKRRRVLSFHCDFDSYGRSCNSYWRNHWLEIGKVFLLELLVLPWDLRQVP